MNVRLTGEGTRPLFMHNVRLASPLDPFAKELAKLQKAKRPKDRTDEDRLAIARVEWEGGLYHRVGVGPYVPASWIFKSLLEAGRSANRRGQKIEGGVQVVELEHPLLYQGPRDIPGLWGESGNTRFVDFRTARVGQSKVDRCRPVFPDWKFEAELLIDESVIDFDEVAEIAAIAGKLKGLGDYRQQFGRFDVLVEKI